MAHPHDTTDSSQGQRPGRAPRWRAVLLGGGVTWVTIILLGGIVAGARWLIGPTGGLLAALGIVSLVFAVALGAALAAARTERGFAAWTGLATAAIAVASIVLVATPVVAPVADFRSVAIALDWIDAPNIGTRPSEALHGLFVDQHGAYPDPTDALAAARRHVRRTGVFLGTLVLALAVAGALGARATRRGRAVAPAAAGMVGLGIVTVTLWSSVMGVANAIVDFDQSRGPEIGVSLSEVAGHPDVMEGSSVTISARVDHIVNPHIAVLGNHTPLVGNTLVIASGEPLADVVLTEAAGATLSAGDVVQVTGTVRLYSQQGLREAIGVDAADVLGEDESAVLVAEAIDPDVPVASEAGDKEFGNPSSGYDYGITIDVIIHGTDDYTGLTVTVSDDVEEGLMTPHAFVLGDEHLLVISPRPRNDIFVESTVYATGEVRVFHVADVEDRLGIPLDDNQLRDFEGKPFILVESIVVVA